MFHIDQYLVIEISILDFDFGFRFWDMEMAMQHLLTTPHNYFHAAGYWADELRKRGSIVYPYDARPPTQMDNSFHESRTYTSVFEGQIID